METSLVDVLLVGTNLLVVLASLAVALVTVLDIEKDQQRTIKELIRALVKTSRTPARREEEVK